MKLVVGLGNPGRKYETTRHNLGFLVVDEIARQHHVDAARNRCDALVAETTRAGEQVVLAKPQTYMNGSGSAVSALLRRFGAGPQDLIVVYDDLDLPLGRIRIRSNGSAGGHRGMVSIIDSLAGSPFFRVRIGIGRPPEGVDPAEYVLERFSPEEREQVPAIVDKAAQAVLVLIENGGPYAMERFNRVS